MIMAMVMWNGKTKNNNRKTIISIKLIKHINANMCISRLFYYIDILTCNINIKFTCLVFPNEIDKLHNHSMHEMCEIQIRKLSYLLF